jgi:RHS repeat-associated protein
VLASFSASAIQGEQLYSPYGTRRYTVGTLGTDKGYTGQFHDNVTGLDYYHARYYDPVAGVFLLPDRVQGNKQGMDPYSYVAGNPETKTDPTGHYYAPATPGAPDDTPTQVRLQAAQATFQHIRSMDGPIAYSVSGLGEQALFETRPILQLLVQKDNAIVWINVLGNVPDTVKKIQEQQLARLAIQNM